MKFHGVNSTIEYGATWKVYEKLMKFDGVNFYEFQQLNMELHMM